MNKVTLSGYLANNPELRLIKRKNKQDLHITNFVLKERRYYKGKITDNYIPCFAVGQVAQNLTKYKKINDFITLNGKFISRKMTIPTKKADNSDIHEESAEIKTILVLAQLIEWPVIPSTEKLKKFENDKDNKNIENNQSENKTILDDDAISLDDIFGSSNFLTFEDLQGNENENSDTEKLVFDDSNVSDIIELSDDDIILDVNAMDIF